MSGFWKGKTCLVTGATGFLGGSLVSELLREGAEVVALVRDMVPQSRFQSEGLVARAKVVRGALEDYDVIERALNEYAIDTVFHLGAQAIVGVANRNPLSTFEANIKGTWVLLEACRRVATVERIVIASSDKAYGDHDVLPYQEDFALQGRHPYDVSKSCADLIALSYAATYRLPVTITRCGNLFGPGDLNSNRIVPGTCLAAIDGTRPLIRSDGSPVRDYVFVEDIVRGYLLLARHMGDADVVGRAFNFGTGEPVSVLDLTRRTLAAAGRADLEPDVRNNAHGEIQAQYLSSALAAEKLGWAPGAGLDERLAQTFLWYKAHRHFF
ncbi:sugar dehydratase [Sphingobium sp. Leaf26]|uniref:NAD-dependent epimerase/dehydratase family protein n=1 Tax=Sphingobium sp. Leaf26 TaxID=1735693 RepID=UPI0006FA8ED3|nr:NAD-dependent epimerase/dehydratase family protein [Sphingobium sp. Leaf26]KQN04203.1 sugar dehydratase [Sphingobium sp. Leaf26]